MKKSDLLFDYPEHLVATERKSISRVMFVRGGEPQEVTPHYILTQIEPGDVLVVNETKVIPARMVSESGLEILFIENIKDNQWKVLCPVRRWKGETQRLPGGVELRLVEKGLPQTVEANQALDEKYFLENGDMPLPPYIQEARGERRSRKEDRDNYQSAWAAQLGSLAAPTASLHFSSEDLEKVKARGADVVKICLHVGLGTFLPIHADNLEDHKMHSEHVEIQQEVWEKILQAKKEGGRIWALGSTVTRSLESMALKDPSLRSGRQVDSRPERSKGSYCFHTDLFIKPGFEYKVVDVLMTNFHQPESTLLAMVMAFSSIGNVKSNYQWAIERNFRLFSYGDLSIWMK